MGDTILSGRRLRLRLRWRREWLRSQFFWFINNNCGDQNECAAQRLIGPYVSPSEISDGVKSVPFAEFEECYSLGRCLAGS